MNAEWKDTMQTQTPRHYGKEWMDVIWRFVVVVVVVVVTIGVAVVHNMP